MVFFLIFLRKQYLKFRANSSIGHNLLEMVEIRKIFQNVVCRVYLGSAGLGLKMKMTKIEPVTFDKVLLE